MKYEQIKELEEKFRRLSGVKRSTFEKMIGILREGDGKRKKHEAGEKQAFFRRTSFDGSGVYSWNTFKWIEEMLIRHPDFALPARKALFKEVI